MTADVNTALNFIYFSFETRRHFKMRGFFSLENAKCVFFAVAGKLSPEDRLEGQLKRSFTKSDIGPVRP